MNESEQEMLRHIELLEGKILQLNKENSQLHAEIRCEEHRFNQLFDDYNNLGKRHHKLLWSYTIFFFLILIPFLLLVLK